MTTEDAEMSGKITPEGVAAMKARVGVLIPQPPPFNTVASEDTIRHYTWAYGDDNPLYAEPEYGKKSRWNSLIAPPGYIATMGTTDEAPIPKEVRQKGAHALQGVPNYQSGSTWEWVRPVYPGDTMKQKYFISAVEEKRSEFGGGKAVIVHHHKEYTNQRNELVAIYKYYFFHVEREASEKTGKYMKIEDPRWTDAQLKEIDECYEREAKERQGAKPRYWEDIKVGQELNTIVKGPLCTTDIISWHVGWGFGVFRVGPLRNGYLNRKRIPAFYTKNEFGAWDVAQRVHWDNARAKKVGNPRAYDYGAMRTIWLIHLITNWMGDEAWLWKESDQTRRFNYHGDIQWCKGKVKDKRMEDKKGVVELEIWCENQRGEIATPGQATVILPTKKYGKGLLPGEAGGYTPTPMKTPYAADIEGCIW